MPWNMIGSIGSALIGHASASSQLKKEQAFNAEQAQINRDFQREERLQTQEYNEMMWEKNNEYNSPANQLKLAMDAGINPNLAISGLGKSTSLSPVTSTPMTGSQATSPSIASGMLTANAQIANLIASARKAGSEKENIDFQTSFDKATADERYRALVKGNEKSDAEIAKFIQDKDIQNETFKIFSQRSIAEMQVIMENLNVLRNQNLNLIKDLDVKDANIRNTDAQTANLQKQGELIDSQTEGQNLSNDIMELKKTVSNELGVPLDTPAFYALWNLWKKGDLNAYQQALIIRAEDAFHSSSSPYGSAAGAIVGTGQRFFYQAREVFDDLATEFKDDLYQNFTDWNPLPSYDDLKKFGKKSVKKLTVPLTRVAR